MEENKQNEAAVETKAPEATPATDAPKAAPTSAAKNKTAPAGDKPAAGRDDRRGGGRGGRRDDRRGGGRGRRPQREPREFEQRILDLARVTRVTTGGKRMRFRVALVIGDGKGRAGFGVAKGADVQIAIEKALHQAKKHVVNLKLVNGTFPHRIEGNFGAADVIIAPAPEGTGLKSGGAVRMILELAGVSNAVTKILRGQNKINIAKATFDAFNRMVVPEGVLTDPEKLAKQKKEKRAEDAKKVTKRPAKKPAAKKPAGVKKVTA